MGSSAANLGSLPLLHPHDVSTSEGSSTAKAINAEVPEMADFPAASLLPCRENLFF